MNTASVELASFDYVRDALLRLEIDLGWVKSLSLVNAKPGSWFRVTAVASDPSTNEILEDDEDCRIA